MKYGKKNKNDRNLKGRQERKIIGGRKMNYEQKMDENQK